MRVLAVDRGSPHLDAWCALLAGGLAAESGDDPGGPALAARVRAGEPEVRRWAAVTGDGIVGVARSAPEPDARFVRLYVPPPHRGRGAGGALLAAVRDAHPDVTLKSIAVAGGPGEAFARHRGATVLMRLVVQEQRLADLPPPPVMPAIPLVFWTGAAPDQLVDSYADAYGHLADAPGSRHQMPDGRFDVARVRRREAAARDGGRELRVCAAVDRGAVVAFTEIETGPGPAASQHATVVLPDRRRHGLGAAVKWALADRLRAERPDVATVTTTVNAANTPMVALNERVGYRPVRTRLLLSSAPAAR